MTSFFTEYPGEYSPRRRNPVRCSTASRSALLGIVPVLIATPPTTSRRSTMHTRRPSFAAWTAARCPAGPLPITHRS